MNFDQLKYEYEVVKAENQVCKRKLDSKCEALQILTKDLDHCRQQRDQFKLMAEQVQARYQAVKRQLAGVGPSGVSAISQSSDFSSTRSQNLPKLLNEMREFNKTLQFERDDFAQKLKDAQGDVKILRQQIARQRVGTTDEGMNTRHFPAHEREDLVKQLEASHEQIAQLQRDIQQVLDEKEDQETERDVYKTKYESLNKQLNLILAGDDSRVVDIDAMINENKFLQERLASVEEEKQIAQATAMKYKSLLEKKKQKGILKVGQTRSSGLVISQKQVSELLQGQMTPTPQMVADLQSIASALLDTVSDKNVALSHQRKTNKVLGNRVSELEEKVRRLELSANVSSSGKQGGLDKLKLECDELRNMLPRHPESDQSDSEENASFVDGDSEITTPSSSTQTTPVHTGQTVSATNSNSFLLEDLDLLPTKDSSKPRVYSEDLSTSHQELSTSEKLQTFKNATNGAACEYSDSDDVFASPVRDQQCDKTDMCCSGDGTGILAPEKHLDDETASKLQHLMEEMTSRVKERSRSISNEGKEVNIPQSNLLNKADSTDKSPLLPSDQESSKQNTVENAELEV